MTSDRQESLAAVQGERQGERVESGGPQFSPKAPAALPWDAPWSFNAKSTIDQPYHDLTSYFGKELTAQLDEIVFDTPVRAGARATKLYQAYSQHFSRLNLQDAIAVSTREVMGLIANTISTQFNALDDQALVPPQAVFKG